MRSSLSAALTAGAVLAAVAGSPAEAKSGSGTVGLQKRYERMITFGASYVDDAHSAPIEFDYRFAKTPYYQGRFSNGPVISEYLAHLLSPALTVNLTNAGEDDGNSTFHYINRAYAGAVTSNNVTNAEVPDVGQQIANFELGIRNANFPTTVSPLTSKKRAHGVSYHERKRRSHGHKRKRRSSCPNQSAPPTSSQGQSAGGLNDNPAPISSSGSGEPASLILIEIGLNSLKYIFADPLDVKSTSSMAERDANITASTKALSSALWNLTYSDEFRRFSSSKSYDVMVFDMFPLDLIPNWSENPGNMTELRREIDMWNGQVQAMLGSLQANAEQRSTGDRFFTWDSQAFWNATMTNPSQSGLNLTHVKVGCVTQEKNGTNVVCNDPQNYFYWDSVHPTTTIHKAIAASVLKDAYQV